MDFNPELLLELVRRDVSVSVCAEKSAAIDSLLQSLFKKWAPADTRELDILAVDGFLSSNKRCGDINLPLHHETFSEVKYLLETYFNDGPYQTSTLTLDTCVAKGRTGPGSSVGTRATDFFHKMFWGPMSTTDSLLYYHYKNALSPRWLTAELLRSSHFGVDVVQGSSLSTVPKNAKISRTICTEPSLNMFYQLGAGEIISEKLRKYHNIDLSLQPDINRQMAREGSINGRFATIDLSSASDTISSRLVEHIMPASTLGVMRLIRSPKTRYKGTWYNLDLWSSMGNGFTFPLQTLIFATLIRVTYRQLGIIPKVDPVNRNYSVFGDDIICLSEAYGAVVENLERFGFIVNLDKSFNDGPFRESCGQDFFQGYDIRGVYLRRIQDEQDIYSAFNRLARWSCRHGIYLPSALRYLKGLADVRPVPFDESDDAGIKTPFEYVPRKPGKYRPEAQCYRALARPTRVLRIKPALADYAFDGCIIAAIGGYIRGHRITVRNTTLSSKVVKRKIPWYLWDRVTDAGLTIRDYQLLWSLL